MRTKKKVKNPPPRIGSPKILNVLSTEKNKENSKEKIKIKGAKKKKPFFERIFSIALWKTTEFFLKKKS